MSVCKTEIPNVLAITNCHDYSVQNKQKGLISLFNLSTVFWSWSHNLIIHCDWGPFLPDLKRHAHTPTYTDTCARTHAHIHTHIHTSKTHTPTYTDTCTCICTHMHTRRCKPTCTHNRHTDRQTGGPFTIGWHGDRGPVTPERYWAPSSKLRQTFKGKHAQTFSAILFAHARLCEHNGT